MLHFTLSQFKIHACQVVLGTALCDPAGKSLKHHWNKVPDHVSGTLSSVTTYPGLRTTAGSSEPTRPCAQPSTYEEILLAVW